VKAYWGTRGVAPLILLTLAVDGGGQLHDPAALPPRESASGTHWIGGWAGPRGVLDAVVNRKTPSPHWESNSRTPIVEPVA
jgi:hypothetical protein